MEHIWTNTSYGQKCPKFDHYRISSTAREAGRAEELKGKGSKVDSYSITEILGGRKLWRIAS